MQNPTLVRFPKSLHRYDTLAVECKAEENNANQSFWLAILLDFISADTVKIQWLQKTSSKNVYTTSFEDTITIDSIFASGFPIMPKSNNEWKLHCPASWLFNMGDDTKNLYRQSGNYDFLSAKYKSKTVVLY